MKNILYILLFIIFSNTTKAECMLDDDLIDSFILGEDRLKSISTVTFYYQDGRQFSGSAELVGVTDSSYFLRYKMDYGMKGAFYFILDLSDSEVFMLSVMDGAQIQKKLTKGVVDSDNCQLEFGDSVARYLLKYDSGMSLNYFYKDEKEAKVKIVFK